MQKMSFVIRGMESELCDHQRFHMETWSQHDAHASLVCTLCPLCWYKLYPVACYWAGKVWLWSLTSRLFFFLVSKLLSDLLKYEIWVWHSNSDFHFILFCGEFLENFDLEILKMEYISSQNSCFYRPNLPSFWVCFFFWYIYSGHSF